MVEMMCSIKLEIDRACLARRTLRSDVGVVAFTLRAVFDGIRAEKG